MWGSLYFLVVFYAPLIAKLEFPSLLFFFFFFSFQCLSLTSAGSTDIRLADKAKTAPVPLFMSFNNIRGVGGLRLYPQARWKMENLYTFHYFWIT